jgi:molybdopterin molybdotransferase
MEIEIQLVPEPIAEKISPPSATGAHGAWLEFRGIVRGEESRQTISALEYEAYSPMAENEMRRILESLAVKHPCLAAKVIHRVGVIPVGVAAIYVGVASSHRSEGIALLAEFMDRLKQDVPIWKRRGIVAAVCDRRLQPESPKTGARRAPLQLDEALAEIQSRCQPLPAVRAPLAEAFGCVLRETVSAPSDLPDCDRSTRDGYAILQNDVLEIFRIVDTLHAADWKPRQLKSGEAVRIATGAALPGGNLRVVIQESVEQNGDQIRIIRREDALNIRKRGEDVKAGQPLVQAGARLDAGKLALLASAGCARPLVSPRFRVTHFTTGDEIIPPDQTPKPGQIHDSNSFLIRGLLQKFPCELKQVHLPEDFEAAKRTIETFNFQPSTFNLLLISGGASVGDKDFTRPLLEWLGFEIVFSQVNVRPGRPLIFGVNGDQMAFGLPGNPLSHFVCFHLFVATALARLVGEKSNKFLHGKLAAKLDDAPNPRETLWPARRDAAGLHPLAWASSGDVTCLAEPNALIRVPANRGPIDAGTEVEFLPTNS